MQYSHKICTEGTSEQQTCTCLFFKWFAIQMPGSMHGSGHLNSGPVFKTYEIRTIQARPSVKSK